MDDVLERLRDLGSVRRAKKGELLVVEGDPIEGFFWLLEGSVRVYQMNLKGREFEVARFGPGQWVAPALALSTGPFPHFVAALSTSRLLFFPRASTLERITHDPLLAEHFLTLLASRCRLMQNRLSTLQLHTLRDRVEQYLLQACARDGRCVVRLPMPKQELARTLATTPESLSRTLRQLEDEGQIEVKGRAIKILECKRGCG